MNWDSGWHHHDVGPGWWLLMAIMMLVFWGGLAWLIVTVIRNGAHAHPPSGVGPQGERPDPEQILHERFARGEIDTEEYYQRIDALRAKRPQPT